MRMGVEKFGVRVVVLLSTPTEKKLFHVVHYGGKNSISQGAVHDWIVILGTDEFISYVSSSLILNQMSVKANLLLFEGWVETKTLTLRPLHPIQAHVMAITMWCLDRLQTATANAKQTTGCLQ